VARLIQFHPSVSGRDAIGNEMLALHRAARRAGIDSRIHAVDAGSVDGATVRDLRRLDVTGSDTLLIHYSLGHAAFDDLVEVGCRRLMLFHDVTPPELLCGAPREIVENARQGLERAGWVSGRCQAVAVHSNSSAASLSAWGGPRAEILPYLMRPELLKAEPDRATLAEAKLSGSTLLAAGRVLPHKRIEDVILVYDYLRRISARHWRLVVVGSTGHAPGYVESLASLCRKMGLPRVQFTGSVSQAEMNAWFRVARAFISMSVHEGFCVPLVEAMHHRAPVFALAAAATPETLQGAGVTFESPDWPAIAEAIDAVDQSPELRKRILDRQDQAVGAYEPAAATQTWLDWLAGAGQGTDSASGAIWERKKRTAGH